MNTKKHSDTQPKYSITVHNDQGASDKAVGKTADEIDLWLSNWQDPQNLVATVRDEHGDVIIVKPIGHAEIVWLDSE
jgi:hypothetical protein